MPSVWSQDLFIQAYRFAAQAHWEKAQLVPGTQIPYLMHFSLVAMEVMAALAVESGLDGNLSVQGALLHDTLEDTDTEYNELVNEFGGRVADAVMALTKDKTVGSGITDRWQQKKLQMAKSLKRIKSQPREVWMIKMADRITNLQPPPQHWTEYKVQRYKLESIEIFESLKDGSAFLSDRLKHKIEIYPYPGEE
jgi:(p)ppGpp synthase/HD superfamily hydrolase